MSSGGSFFEVLQSYPVIIDRPAGSCHPKYPAAVYPVDYGYIAELRSVDGGGLDVFVGTSEKREVSAVILCLHLLKSELEPKILMGCTDAEVEQIKAFLESDLQLTVWAG